MMFFLVALFFVVSLVAGLANDQAAAMAELWGQIGIESTPCATSGVVCDGNDVLSIDVQRDTAKKPNAVLPSSLTSLTALQQLILDGVDLADVPAYIGRLTALTELQMNGNRLVTLPSQVGHLTALTIASFHTNELAAVPSQLGLLTGLVELDLSYNLLRAVPSQVGRLNLRTLYLNVNWLAAIPSELNRLTALTHLELNDNSRLVGQLPGGFGGLTQLEYFDVSSTQLSGSFSGGGPLERECQFSRSFVECASVPAHCGCSGRRVGDDCEHAVAVNGSAAFANDGATTCDGCGACEVVADVWFRWRAPCAAAVTVDTCGIAGDTRLALYRNACPAGDAPDLAGRCDDFGAQCELGERAVVDVAAGDSLVIRVGAADDNVPPLAGMLDISFVCVTGGMETRMMGTNGEIATKMETESGTATEKTGESASATETESGSQASVPRDDTAIIAGAVGGSIAALLLVGGLVLWRRRKVAAPSAAAPASEYASLGAVPRPGGEYSSSLSALA